MWPAIVTGFIAAVTLLGVISQRNPSFYNKIVSNSLSISYMVMVGGLGCFLGFSEGIDSAREFFDSLELKEPVSIIGLISLKPNFLWMLFSGLLPMGILGLLYSIRYVAVNIKKSDAVDTET
ncbi:hypothetical protein [Colwellia sp. UCD-KL20]|uniref:hypothetical protein n=1 Tax=Colwellia sp. UCD-KL20 TaxID=1917165 RepID=UPI00097076CF|nr:hypothetical protein [Colwellia sp. UCD-KL20]